jgi:hypothetical protein
MRKFAVLTFAIVVVLGLAADAFAQARVKGVTYQNITASKCKSTCSARGWSADSCKSLCRPGCRQAKTGGENFCVVSKN